MCKAGNRIRNAALLVLPVLAASLHAAGERLSGISTGDTVIIRSHDAWEDEKPDIIHFSGGFELLTGEWQLSADQATLYGKLDDPETVILTGAPASMVMNVMIEGRTRAITGRATRIVYESGSNTIRMQGNASLSRDDNIMQGGEIIYLIDEDQFSAGGDTGVRIRVKPNP